MKRALVLSGGGSRGAYEIGAWQALREMGVRIDAVYGTSIGALNAALVAQGDADCAVRLWDTLTLKQIVGGPVADTFSVGGMISSKRDIVPFLLENAKNLRVDVAPLEALVCRYTAEGLVRASGMEVNVTTVRVPSMTPVQISVREMKPGALPDWLMASAACFPVFPMRVIDGMRYIDGGYYDNLPIDKALRDGADELVCVDVHPDFTHPEYAFLPQMTVIKPRSALGGFLDFDRALLRRSRRLGYLDAMKAYGRYDGVRYAFRRVDGLGAAGRGRKYMGEVARFDARAIGRTPIIKGGDAEAPLLAALEADMPGRTYDLKTGLIRGLELAARACGFREDALYDADELTRLLLEALSAEATPDVPISERSLREMSESGPRALAGYIFRAMARRGGVADQEVRLLAQYPGETAAALYLFCARS